MAQASSVPVSTIAPQAVVQWTEAAQAYAAWAAVAVAILGFVTVVYQIRQLSAAVRADTHGRIYDHALEVQRLFLENPSYRTYFYDGTIPNLNGEERARLLAFAELVADYLEHVTLQCEVVPEHVTAAWRAYIGFFLNHSPVLCEFLSEHRSHYSSKFVAICHEQCKALAIGTTPVVPASPEAPTA